MSRYRYWYMIRCSFQYSRHSCRCTTQCSYKSTLRHILNTNQYILRHKCRSNRCRSPCRNTHSRCRNQGKHYNNFQCNPCIGLRTLEDRFRNRSPYTPPDTLSRMSHKMNNYSHTRQNSWRKWHNS